MSSIRGPSLHPAATSTVRAAPELEAERVVHVFLTTVVLAITLGAFVGFGLGRAICSPTEVETR